MTKIYKLSFISNIYNCYMINKNVADYTNFQGKTNKKIVQAPGGSSSVSLAWSNEPTHYGPDRHIKKISHDPYSDQNNKNPVYQPKPNYSEPMKVMEDPYSYERKKMNYEAMENPMQQKIVGGEYGYDNVKRQSNSSKHIEYEREGNQNSYMNYNRKPQEIDIAVYEQKRQKSHKPPSVPTLPSNDNRACIKMGTQPRQNLILGDANYNYWKDTNKSESMSTKGNSEKKIGYQPYYQQNQQPIEMEKPSIKVRNPPGGQGSFAFG